jgi:CheY-like chemotaxis protein
MDDSILEIGATHRKPARIRLERIGSPFVWEPREPVDMRVAVVGGSLEQREDTVTALRSSGHGVVPYATADGLVHRLRSGDRSGQRYLPPRALDVVVLHGSGDPALVIAALELLRAHAATIPIVLVADDDAEVLANAKRLCIEEVLSPPVHPVALRAAIAAAVFLPVDELVIDSELDEF